MRWRCAGLGMGVCSLLGGRYVSSSILKFAGYSGLGRWGHWRAYELTSMVSQDDTLVPLSLATGTPTPLPHLPQQIQTNQTTFSYSTPPKHLFLTAGDGTVKICRWPPKSADTSESSSASLETIHTLQAHTSATSTLALSSPSTYLAIGGSDALISLWDTKDWVCRRTLSSATGAIRSLSFSFDGSYIVGASDVEERGMGGGKGGLEIYHTETGELLHTVPTQGQVTDVSWHPSRYWLAYCGEPLQGSGLRIVGAGGGSIL